MVKGLTSCVSVPYPFFMELILNTVIAGIVLVQFLAIIGLALLFRRKAAYVSAVFRQFISPEGPELPSPLAKTVDVGCDMFARAVMARAKTTFMGQMSGEVRQEQAIDGAIAEDTARLAHPMAGALMDSFPAVRKVLRKNPQLLDFALKKLLGGVQLPISETQAATAAAPAPPGIPADNGRVNG